MRQHLGRGGGALARPAKGLGTTVRRAGDAPALRPIVQLRGAINSGPGGNSDLTFPNQTLRSGK